MENKKKCKSEDERKEFIENGVLYSSGLIAGEGIVGILLAVLAIIPFNDGSFADYINLGGVFGNTGSIIFFALLLASLIFFSLQKDKEKF